MLARTPMLQGRGRLSFQSATLTSVPIKSEHCRGEADREDRIGITPKRLLPVCVEHRTCVVGTATILRLLQYSWYTGSRAARLELDQWNGTGSGGRSRLLSPSGGPPIVPHRSGRACTPGSSRSKAGGSAVVAVSNLDYSQLFTGFYGFTRHSLRALRSGAPVAPATESRRPEQLLRRSARHRP